MSDTLIVSERGQITLPSSIRKKYGIKGGSALILEERNNELRLKPAEVLEVDLYSDAQIERWDRADVLSTRERNNILKRLQQG